MAALLLAVMICADDEIKSFEAMMFRAYAEGKYEVAKKLAWQCNGLNKAQLVSALCDVYNLKDQNLATGLQELKRLYESDKVAKNIRCQAGLAYARVVQSLNMRGGLYSEVKGIDYEKIYLDIIKSFPDTSSSVLAIMYLTQEWFESSNYKEVAEAFSQLNNFVNSYKGKKQFLVPLHYMLADQYIIHGGHYVQAVKELESAVNNGLSNPRVREDVVYRIARIYDTRLHDRYNALRCYEVFIKRYPGSSKAVLARRYVNELRSGKKR